MSAHRELVNAQQALNEAVAEWVPRARIGPPHIYDHEGVGRTLGMEARIVACYDRLVAEQMRLDTPGGAAPRYTSINAAHANLFGKESLRRNIVLCVVANQAQFHTGMTVSELKARLRKEHSSVSSAINGLMNRGWLRDSGTTRLTQHGQPAIVWEPTEMAVSAARTASGVG